MNILIISNLYEPYARGGAEVVVKRTAQALLRQGHTVSVLTAKPYAGRASFDLKEEVQDGLHLVRFYPLNLFFYPRDVDHSLPIRLFWHALDINNRHSARRVRQHFVTHRYNLVITQNLMGLGYAIPAEIRRAGIRHLHVLHDIQLAVRSGLMRKGEEGRFYTSGWLAKAYQSVVRRQFGSPDLVVSPSQFLLDFYKQRGFFESSQMRVLRNPLDERFLQVQHQPASAVRFGFVGQLAEHKGVSLLQQAVKTLPQDGWSLTVVGNGPMAETVCAWAKADQRIKYLGTVANEQLPAILSQIDFLVVPTRTYENSPTVVFEALASGVPVIVSNIGGAAEAIEEGKNGFIVTPDSPEMLSKVMQMCLTLESEQTEKMREASRASVQGLGADFYVKQLFSGL